MSKKSKGSNAERELLRLFWESGWAAIRAAGSGSTRFPCADIVAGNKTRLAAIECKTTKADTKYIEKQEIEQLKKFSAALGAEPWLAIRFLRSGWLFISLDDLKETENNLAISLKEAKNKGLVLDEFIGGQ